MASSRLFHTLVFAGAALVSAPLLACGDTDGTVTTRPPPDPDGDDDGDDAPTLGTPIGNRKADAAMPPHDAGADTGWAPTK